MRSHSRRAAALVSPVRPARQFHCRSACHALPVPSAVEEAASKWVQTRVNPNRCSEPSNLPLAIALLKAAHRAERSKQSAAHSSNIVINPVSVALQLQRQQANHGRVHSAVMESAGGMDELQFLLSGVDHSRIARELTEANNQFASWTLSPHSSPSAQHGDDASAATSSHSSVHRAPSSSFSGYLAPRFALTKTVSPSWFIPSPTAAQQAAFDGQSSTLLPYRAEDTTVTPLERSIRVAARMLYRTGKLWYVEGTRHQMVDVPYLHPSYSLTLLAARFTDEPSIDDHPQPAYGNLRRERSTIHSVLDDLTPQQLLHDCRYMTLLPGLLVMPAFDAKYSFQLGGDSDSGSGHGLSDMSRMVVSGAGLKSGGLKTLSHRPGRPFPHFLLSAHRPFVFIVRHRPTNHVALIGLVEQVERDTTDYKYKTRKVQWLEDKAPIQQF